MQWQNSPRISFQKPEMWKLWKVTKNNNEWLNNALKYKLFTFLWQTNITAFFFYSTCCIPGIFFFFQTSGLPADSKESWLTLITHWSHLRRVIRLLAIVIQSLSFPTILCTQTPSAGQVSPPIQLFSSLPNNTNTFLSCNCLRRLTQAISSLRAWLSPTTFNYRQSSSPHPSLLPGLIRLPENVLEPYPIIFTSHPRQCYCCHSSEPVTRSEFSGDKGEKGG